MKVKIITAASQSHAESLIALVGSLNINWPNHPPIEIYDIGLDDATKQLIVENGYILKHVPTFCPHWRNHFTWKIWIFKHTDADMFIYCDAGMIILKPLDDLLEIAEQMGYAVFPNYRLLEEEASEQACNGCNLHPDFRKNKTTLAGNLVGYNKTQPQIRSFIDDLYELSLDERNLKAYLPTHRHDQALMSLLLYKCFTNPVMLDSNIYLGTHSPVKVPGQKIWASRRNVNKHDLQHFQKHFNPHIQGINYVPQTPSTSLNSLIDDFAYQMNRMFGKNKSDIGELMLKNSLGKRGSLILKILLKVANYYRQVVYKNLKVNTTVTIYDGVKDKGTNGTK